MSDDRLTRLFEEYRELGHSWRADDARFSSQQVMLFPLSVGALIVSYIHTGIPTLIAIGGGVCLILYWWLIAEINASKLKIRFERMQCIEKQLNFCAHRLYNKRRKGQLKEIHLRRIGVLIYIITVIILLTQAYFLC